jgi:hypothetical protein
MIAHKLLFNIKSFLQHYLRLLAARSVHLMLVASSTVVKR